MTRTPIVVLPLLLLALAFPGRATALQWSPWACGLGERPLVVDYAEISVAPAVRDTFTAARPSRVLATSGLGLGRELRDAGARTVFWEMNLKRYVGNTNAPADPATIAGAADRIYERAVATTDCATPTIALNELQGGWLATPWSAWNGQYRANVLELVRRLHERGAHAYLLVTTSSRPFTPTSEAAEWSRQISQVADIVLQVHFTGRRLYARGARRRPTTPRQDAFRPGPLQRARHPERTARPAARVSERARRRRPRRLAARALASRRQVEGARRTPGPGRDRRGRLTAGLRLVVGLGRLPISIACRPAEADHRVRLPLGAANADLATARHIIGEQLRRREIARTLPRRLSFRKWSLRQQRRALARTVCERDDPPPVGIVDLTRWLPFLKLP